jgi:hypothetical protein
MDVAAAPRAKSLLQHFAAVKDIRQPCKVTYLLKEGLLLVVCGTMAARDDDDDIVLWGKAHLPLLRRLGEDQVVTAAVRSCCGSAPKMSSTPRKKWPFQFLRSEWLKTFRKNGALKHNKSGRSPSPLSHTGRQGRTPSAGC